MNYQEFLAFKTKTLAENPDFHNAAENNLYDCLAHLKPSIPENLPTGYRCHIAEDYLARANLPAQYKTRCSITQGVRHSLTELFAVLDNWIIPADQYPWYSATLGSKPHKTYDTLGYSDVFNDLTDGTLLITCPLKMGGRDYSGQEWNQLADFLQSDPNNLLIVDMVYNLDFNIPAKLLDLYSTNQVVLLYSLSKSFLLPNVCGFTLLPDSLVGSALSKRLNGLAKNQPKIDVGAYVVRNDFETTERIKNHLRERRREVPHLKSQPHRFDYLIYSVVAPEFYLANQMLVIPESVFGGKRNGCVFSVLRKSENE